MSSKKSGCSSFHTPPWQAVQHSHSLPETLVELTQGIVLQLSKLFKYPNIINIRFPQFFISNVKYNTFNTEISEKA